MTIIDNVYARSAALLASQFQESLPNGDKTNFQKLIYSFCTEGQDIQNVLQQLLTERYLSTAFGVQLDGIGQIVGLARIAGQPDDTTGTQTGYRQALEFQIFYNSSNATPEEIIFIAAFITASTHVNYIEYYPAAYQVVVNNVIINGFFGSYQANTIPTLLKNAGPAGVEYPPVTTTMGVPRVFAWSSDVLFEQLYVTQDDDLPGFLVPFNVEFDATSTPFFIQRGETINLVIGGGFAEYYVATNHVDTTNAGQLCEVVQLNGNLPP